MHPWFSDTAVGRDMSFASSTQYFLSDDGGWSSFLQNLGKTNILLDTLMIPTYFSILSAIIFLIRFIATSKVYRNLRARLFRKNVPVEEEEQRANIPPVFYTPGFVAEFHEHVAEHGGPTIFLFKVAQLIGCLTLLGLSIASAIINEGTITDGINALGKWGKKHEKKKHPPLSIDEWLELAMCMTYFYALVLAIASVASKSRWSRIVSRHLSTLLIVTFCVYAYRDLLPLATFKWHPLDRNEGWILWAKIAVLVVSAIIIPLGIPAQYVPVDHKSPSSESNPEQTASLFSLMTYTYLDPVIWLGYRSARLSTDQLPPLSDYDQASTLKAQSFPHLDTFKGAKKRHLFFGLMRVFAWDYAVMSFMVVVHVAISFVSPLSINRLLSYLEPNGKSPLFRPWVWILGLFVGPTFASIAFQWYIYSGTRTLVRTEGILTQLVFEHALRIRVKAETGSTSNSVSQDDSVPAVIETDDGGSNTARDESPLSSRSESSDQETVHSQGDTLDASTVSVLTSSTQKGKGSKQASTSRTEQDSTNIKEDGNAQNLVGKINNLVTTDLGNITEARDFILVLVYIPVQIVLCIAFLYMVLGWSSFVGLAVILLLFPIPGYLANKVQHVQQIRLKKTDARVQAVTETMNVLRMVKLFGWESKMNDKIAEKREEELLWLWKRQILDLINGDLNYLIPILTMLATYSTYVCLAFATIIMKEELSASKVFSSMSVFDMLRDQLHLVFYCLTQSATGKVSLDRLSDFLHNTELLDSFTEKKSGEYLDAGGQVPKQTGVLGIKDATFAWTSESTNGTATPSKRNFLLKVEGEVTFKKGCINLITGPTGSGKTSLLMALLGEMHYIANGPESWFNLPRERGVAYAAQESWVQNETIKDNILFGAPLDEERYKMVIYQCCLERDLELFEAGDNTEVGEKGLTLSGGQKARITLARAIYSRAEVILLDDVLAALDVHTAKWIVDKCFSGDLIRGRTVLLVTHNIAMARPVAEYIVTLGVDGRVASAGPLTAEAVVGRDAESLPSPVDAGEPIASGASKVDGKLIVAEEVEEGHVSRGALKMYFSGLGGSHPILFFTVFILALLFTELLTTFQTWYLGYWASQYETHHPSEVPVFYYLGNYGTLLLIAVVIYCSSYIVYIFGVLRASRKLHRQLVEAVLGTTLRWLDTTPTSRVVTRCTQDIRAVDGPISNGLWWLSELTTAMFVKFSAVILFTPIFLIPGVLVAVIGGCAGQLYIAAQLSVKREMSNAKAPVLGHFGAAIAGLTSIRAYGAQSMFMEESLKRINRYTRSARIFYNLNRWICVRIDAIGGMFAAGLAAWLVYFQGLGANTTGFSLNMAVGFSGMILWWVRVFNDFEVQGNSLERIQGYVEIEQELKPTEQGKPPAAWPTSGDLRVENLSARYSLDGPKVLHDLSFHIKSGERIGVVGRTGSGKSSLTLSLLRCIFTTGDVYYDGVRTSTINLDSLRSNITIIPQVPELLSGTLRHNLDPFDQYDDATLNDTLRAAGLFNLQTDLDEGRLTLDSSIASGGSNLSVGQRQILALARAIIRGSKLLILDEATSAIDYKTDSVIQSSLRHELRGDVTLITVAHRLQTIMDADKIMVLDAGRIVEFDSPKVLLGIDGGRLRALVDESGDREALYTMAGVTAPSNPKD